MDVEILVRDTRIYVHAVWRLLTDEVVPLDYAAYAGALLQALDGLGGAAEERGLDLSALVADVKALQSAAKGASGDATLMDASRRLVPLDYTTGDRFDHDPALGFAPFPVLDPIRALAAADPGSDAAKFALVAAIRARNRVAHAVAEATAILAK